MVLTLFLGRLTSKRLNSVCAYTFIRHLQLPFLNQQKGENDCENDFVINFHERYVAELGFELASPRSTVKHASHCPI